MPESRGLRSRQLKRMMFVIVSAPKEYGIAISSVFGHAHHVHKKTQAFLRLGSQQFHMTEMGDIMNRFRVCHFLFLSTTSRRPCRSYDICPASSFLRKASSFANLSSEALRTLSTRSRLTQTPPSASSTRISPDAICAPPTVTVVLSSPRSEEHTSELQSLAYLV